VVGRPVMLTATVAGTGNTPTGTVTFTAANGSLTGCDARPVTSGQATCSVTFAHATQSPLALTAAYSGDGTHPSSEGRLSLTVAPATPVITWAAPNDITYPTPLGPSQLNATADVPGTSTYALHAGGAAEGTILHAGSGQLIDVSFVPENSADYTTASAQAAITVLPGPQVISVDPIPTVTVRSGTTSVTAHGGGSGLSVTFTSTSPQVCSVASTTGAPVTTATIEILSVGTCSLVATQDGDTDWAPAPQVTVTFAIVAPTSTPSVDVTVSAD
jgi:hypothetical protein